MDQMENMVQHLNAMTNRLINAEMALDVTLGMLFDKNEGFQAEFTEKFEQRIQELNDAKKVAFEKAQAEAEQNEPSPIITP